MIKGEGIMFKYFIFTDVHSHLSELLSGLKKEGFDPKNKQHILLSMGDFFDRGKESKELFEFLNEFKKKGRFYGIRGNHDDMLLGFIKNYNRGESIDYFNFTRNGMKNTIESFLGRWVKTHHMAMEDKKDDIRKEITDKNPELVSFLEELHDEIQLKAIDDRNYIFTHAGYKHIINENQLLKNLSFDFLHADRFENEKYGADIWIPFNWSNAYEIQKFLTKYISKDLSNTYVFGHWHASDLNLMFNPNNLEGDNLNLFKMGNMIGLDTATALTKKVNVMVLKSLELPNITQPNVTSY